MAGKTTIVWDFHSLLLAIQMMFSFMLTDEKSPLKVCKHCGKVFLASRPNTVFCSGQCKNQYNVYKSRGERQEGGFAEWRLIRLKECIIHHGKNQRIMVAFIVATPATTREHVPSKAFLQEPYPDNLPTIPACFACNDGYSEDENYVSCFLDILKSQIYSDYSEQEQTNSRIANDKKLENILQEQIKTQDGKVFYQQGEERNEHIYL